MKLKIALLCLLSLFSTTVYAAELNVNGTSIPISNSNYVGYFMDETNVYRAQSIVDSYQVAVSNSPLYVNDGKSSHLMAHNPGLFSVIADSIYNGAIYTVTDDNGNKHAYQFYYVGEVEAYTHVEPGHPIYDASCLTGEEALSLQYCAYGTAIPQVWLGRPVAMPVEEPVEVAEEPVEVVEEPVDVVEEPVEVVEEPVEDVEEPVEEVQEPVTEKVKDVKEKDKTPSSSNGAKEKDKTSSSNNVAVKSRKRNMKSNMNNFKKLAFMLPVLFVVGCTAKTKIKPTVEQSTVDSSAIVDGVEAIDESDISNALTEDPSVNIENNIKSAIPKIYTAKHVLTVPETTEVTVEKSDNGYVAHLSVDGVEIGVINVVDNVYDFVELDTFSTYATVESRSE